MATNVDEVEGDVRMWLVKLMRLKGVSKCGD